MTAIGLFGESKAPVQPPAPPCASCGARTRVTVAIDGRDALPCCGDHACVYVLKSRALLKS